MSFDAAFMWVLGRLDHLERTLGRMAANEISRPWYDVRQYGATGNGGTDDTAAINAAVAAARAGRGIVFFPAGSYSVTSINMTGCQGVTLQGAGVQATTIMPHAGATNIIDGVGSSGCILRDFQIGAFNATGAQTAILLASDSAHPSGLDRWHLENLYVSGSYSKATLYVYGIVSSTAVNCDFYNYQSGGGTVAFFTSQNTASAASAYATITAATINTTDWTLVGCEIHDASASVSGMPLRINGTGSVSGDLRFVGGNISAFGSGSVNANQYVYFDGTTHNVVFAGTTFYADVGPNPLFVTNVASGTLTGLAMFGCVVNAATTVFAGAALTTYDQVFYRGAVTAPSIIGNGLAITVTSADVDCGGRAVSISSGTITGVLHNPGTVTAGSDQTQKMGANWPPIIVSLGNDTALTAGGTVYYGPGMGGATEANLGVVAPRAMTLTRLRVATGGSPGSGQTFTFTLRKNLADTAITCSMTGAAISASDTAHAVVFAAGDRITLKAVASGASSSTGCVLATVSGFDG